MKFLIVLFAIIAAALAAPQHGFPVGGGFGGGFSGSCKQHYLCNTNVLLITELVNRVFY